MRRWERKIASQTESEPSAAEKVVAATRVIVEKWVAGYRELLIPTFDAGSVFGEELEPEDVWRLDAALAELDGRELYWKDPPDADST